MAQRAVGVTDLAGGAGVVEYRTRERTVAGATVVEQYLIFEDSERVQTFKGMASSLVIPSTADIASLFNKTGSGTLVAVRRFSLQNDYTSTTATVRDIDAIRVTVAPTGGTLATPVAWDTAVNSHAAQVEFRYAASADDVLSVLTVTTTTPQAWSQSHSRMISAAEQQRFIDGSMVPDLAAGDPVVLREGEGLLMHNFGSVPTSGHAHYVINAMWEEYSLP